MSARVFAAADGFLRQSECIRYDHTLIEYETVAFPVLATLLFEIADDPTVQLIDVFEPALFEQG